MDLTNCLIFAKYDSDSTLLALRKWDKWEVKGRQVKSDLKEPLTGIVYLHHS